ncbi:unnamed protein product [Auanema sp. JU1783]|nr:unnamed protein product [Auanema sp. JU1783]
MSDEEEVVASSTLYKDQEEWKDITPIYPAAEELVVVKIAVSEQFRDAFAYFRAILQKNEKSARAFRLTEDCIQLNPANYTLWQYRREIIKELKLDLAAEMKYLNDIISENPKNYQVWHHRRIIAEWVGSSIVPSELQFTYNILDEESKNYHAWQHRQWVVKTWPDRTTLDKELSYTFELLIVDPRNNSAWNYRYFVLRLYDALKEAKYIDMEFSLAKKLIEGVPNNESAWNYIAGLLLENGLTSNEGVTTFVEDLYERTERSSRSPHLISFLCDILLEKLENKVTPVETCGRIKELYNELLEIDPVRCNYWTHQQKHAENLLQKSL